MLNTWVVQYNFTYSLSSIPWPTILISLLGVNTWKIIVWKWSAPSDEPCLVVYLTILNNIWEAEFLVFKLGSDERLTVLGEHLQDSLMTWWSSKEVPKLIMGWKDLNGLVIWLTFPLLSSPLGVSNILLRA